MRAKSRRLALVNSSIQIRWRLN